MKKILYLIFVLIICNVSFGQQLFKATWVRGDSCSIDSASQVDTLSRILVGTTANNLSTISGTGYEFVIYATDSLKFSSTAAFTAGTVIYIRGGTYFDSGLINYYGNHNIYIKSWSRGAFALTDYIITFRGF